MREIFIVMFFLLASKTYGQNYSLPDGQYMDTTVVIDTTCKQNNIYFYSVNGKYPESSITLLKKVQIFLQQKGKTYSGSGYITFRFRVNCEGHKMKRTQVLQVDENYKHYYFEKGFVNELYSFLNTLDKWRIAKNENDNTFSYHSFISFKIQDGKVVNIIP